MIEQMLLTAVSMAMSALGGFAIARLRQMGRRDRARLVVDRSVARMEIRDAYERYVIRHEHITDARYNELLELYDAYAALGGNGTAAAWMEEIRAKRPFLVID